MSMRRYSQGSLLLLAMNSMIFRTMFPANFDELKVSTVSVGLKVAVGTTSEAELATHFPNELRMARHFEILGAPLTSTCLPLQVLPPHLT